MATCDPKRELFVQPAPYEMGRDVFQIIEREVLYPGSGLESVVVVRTSEWEAF